MYFPRMLVSMYRVALTPHRQRQCSPFLNKLCSSHCYTLLEYLFLLGNIDKIRLTYANGEYTKCADL